MEGGVILVTGATGNVGRALVGLLLEDGQEVVAAGRSREGIEACFGSKVTVVVLDLSLIHI